MRVVYTRQEINVEAGSKVYLLHREPCPSTVHRTTQQKASNLSRFLNPISFPLIFQLGSNGRIARTYYAVEQNKNIKKCPKSLGGKGGNNYRKDTLTVAVLGECKNMRTGCIRREYDGLSKAWVPRCGYKQILFCSKDEVWDQEQHDFFFVVFLISFYNQSKNTNLYFSYFDWLSPKTIQKKAWSHRPTQNPKKNRANTKKNRANTKK